ncbi:MAG: GntR family transcriptional regulator [Actinobacteria bacterium]|nr:GntR family transcriptional regulator [Actinomycetota bacterium]
MAAAGNALPGETPTDPVFDLLAIERSSTSEQVASALRAKITGGELVPGTPLPEVTLAGSMGVSRNTAREALRILTREGLVSHNMHRGATVATLSEQDVADIFRVRWTLEMAGVGASAYVDAARLQPLRDAIAAMASAALADELGPMIEADVEFHRQLVGLLESPRLNRFFEELQGELWLCLALITRLPEKPDPLIDEHTELYELMTGGEQVRCRRQLEQHLAESEENLKSIARNMSNADQE